MIVYSMFILLITNTKFRKSVVDSLIYSELSRLRSNVVISIQTNNRTLQLNETKLKILQAFWFEDKYIVVIIIVYVVEELLKEK